MGRQGDNFKLSGQPKHFERIERSCQGNLFWSFVQVRRYHLHCDWQGAGFVALKSAVPLQKCLRSENHRPCHWYDHVLIAAPAYFSVSASLTCCGSFEARVFGYIKGASVSTRSLSRGITWSCRILRTPSSDLSFHRYPETAWDFWWSVLDMMCEMIFNTCETDVKPHAQVLGCLLFGAGETVDDTVWQLRFVFLKQGHHLLMSIALVEEQGLPNSAS